MRFELFIANRYLRAKRRQAVIGVITAVSVLGITAGVASLVIALSVNNGFRQDLQQRLLGSTAHVSLLRIQNDGIPAWRPLLEHLSRAPHVVAASPAVYEQVLISRGARARGAVLKGMVPQYERSVSDLLNTVHQGSAADLDAPASDPPGNPPTSLPSSPARSVTTEGGSPSSLEGARQRVASLPPVILGQDMANDLGAGLGSVVLVTSPQGELTPFGMSPKYVRFRVVGIFQSGFYDYDSSWVFTRMSDAQDLFGLGDVIQVIEFKVDDLDRAAEIGRNIEAAAGTGFQTTNWMQQNRALFRALRLERVVTLITIGLIVLVAALNILISLTMMVMEKTRDIAVLMSLGTKREQIRRIFVAQGMVIGGAGTALGLAIGYGFAWAGATYHFLSLSAEVYSIDYVPFAPRLVDGLLIAALTLGISFLATIYPSLAASRILPAEALRYE